VAPADSANRSHSQFHTAGPPLAPVAAAPTSTFFQEMAEQDPDSTCGEQMPVWKETGNTGVEEMNSSVR